MKKIILSICFLFLVSQSRQVYAQELSIGKVVSTKTQGNDVLFYCEAGRVAKISIVTSDMIRVQISETGVFKESAMIKLGFVKDDFSDVDFDFKENNNQYTITTETLSISVEKPNFRIQITDKTGKVIIKENSKLGTQTGGKNTLNFDMPADEHFFGFGFMRETLDARGRKLTFKRDYRWKEATVPYFMSTRGYAFYSNSAYNHDFDFTGKPGERDYYSITTGGGLIDYYIIYGPDFSTLLDRYTNLTGKTMMVPRWAFGLQYRLRYYGDQEELLKVAKEFRAKEIPIDMMALEPGWEETAYSMDWKWSKERFPDPDAMIKELADMGMQLDLWESGVAPTEGITNSKVRKNWFNHRKSMIKSGVKMFKQDDPYPRSIISSELLDPVLSGKKLKDKLLNSEELNNVANSIYSETLFEEYRKLTNERAVVMFHAYNASVASHRWPFQWAGDFQAANGMMNASLSGHAMVSYDIRNPYAAGWHQGFFTPFSVLDSWAYYREPWLYSESIEQSHRIYACLRSRLVPYLYSSLWQSHTKALPIERPMVLNYSDDPNTYNMSSQFMVGDWFLLALSDADDSPSGEKIDFWTGSQKGNFGRAYLPAGTWIDYWSGEVKNIDKAQYVNGEWPEYLGGLLYVKAGAIIPMGQVENYINETKDEVMVLDIYPHKKSSYELYEDDGLSYNYEEGHYAITTITSEEKQNTVDINISERIGTYKDMPKNRSYIVKAHSLIKPKQVMVDGTVLPYFKNSKDLIFSISNNGWYYDTDSKKAIIKLDNGWNYKMLDADVDPMATIPNTAKYELINWDSKAFIKTGNRSVKIEFPTKPVPMFASTIEAMPADGFSMATINIGFNESISNLGAIHVKLNELVTFIDGSRSKEISNMDDLKGLSVITGKTSGLAKLTVSGDSIETAIFELPIYGKPETLKLESEKTVLVADGKNKQQYTVKLYDKLGQPVLTTSYPLIIDIKGEAFSENTLKKDTISFVNGVAKFRISSTPVAGNIQVAATYNTLKDQNEIQSAKGIMQVRMNPPEKVKLDSDGGWIPDNVTVFINFRAQGKLIKNNESDVVLNVYNKQRELLDTYTEKAKKGEVIFKDITYYKRPAQVWFEVTCDGYDAVERKVFENTWDVKESAVIKKVSH